MKTIKSEFIGTDATGKDFYRCIIVSESAPDSFPTSGADVDGVPDTAGIAAGSVLLTPDGNSVLYADDWAPSEGITVTIINQSGDKVDVSYMEEIDPGSATWVSVNDSSTEIISDLSSGIYFYFDSIDDQQITATGEYTTVTEHGATLYQCSSNVTFTVISK